MSMEFIFILMFLFIIIAPFIYFLYIFRHLSKITKISAAGITIFSLITIMIKLFFHPYSTVFLTLTTIVQFYIITVFISPLKFFFKNSVSFLRFVKFSFSAIRPYKKGVSIFICFGAKIGIKYEIS